MPSQTVFAVAASVLIVAAPLPSQQSGDLEFFERRIRPLLAERCFACHGPDAGSRRFFANELVRGLREHLLLVIQQQVRRAMPAHFLPSGSPSTRLETMFF